MTRKDLGRPIERALAVEGGELRCPRRGLISEATCEGCVCLCGFDGVTSSLICSYPLSAADTFARRSLRRQAVRIAVSHRLERT